MQSAPFVLRSYKTYRLKYSILMQNLPKDR
jgi:hypothetical protein